jgi:hypothetical protein
MKARKIIQRNLIENKCDLPGYVQVFSGEVLEGDRLKYLRNNSFEWAKGIIGREVKIFKTTYLVFRKIEK